MLWVWGSICLNRAKPWLTEMWLWQETTAWMQDTKELHNPTLFITSATDRQSERYSLFTKDKKTAQIPLDVILLQILLSINICIVYLFISCLWLFAEFMFFLRGVRQTDKLIHYPFVLFALFRNWHRSRHDVWSPSFFQLYLGDTLRGQMSWNSWTLLHLHNKKEHEKI